MVSTTDADANDISITASTGNMTVVTVTAGAGAAGDVTLEATLGSVLDDIVDATLITADVLTIFAFQQIGAPPLTNPNHIDSKAISLVARITGSPVPLAGSPGIWITEVDDLTVTSARTNDGVIILRAGGTMTALLVSAAELPGALVRNVNLSAVNFVVAAGSLLSATGNVTLNALTGPSTVNFAGDVDANLMTINGTGLADIFNIRPDGDGPGGDLDTPITVNGNAPAVAPGDVLNSGYLGQDQSEPDGQRHEQRHLELRQCGQRGLYKHRTGERHASANELWTDDRYEWPAGRCQWRGGRHHSRSRQWSEPGSRRGRHCHAGVQREHGRNRQPHRSGLSRQRHPGHRRIAGRTAAVLRRRGGTGRWTWRGPDRRPYQLDVHGASPVTAATMAIRPSTSTSTATRARTSCSSTWPSLTRSSTPPTIWIPIRAATWASARAAPSRPSARGNWGFRSKASRRSPSSAQGGTFTADASSSPPGDVTSLTIDDAPGAGTTSITPNAGSATFEPVVFSGFTGLVVRGGLGSQTIDLVNVDAASGLTNIVLDADNLTNTDISADTVSVQSTAGLPATVRMLAGQGNDTFRIEKTSRSRRPSTELPGRSSSARLPDRLSTKESATIRCLSSDIGDASGDTVLINEFSIEGITGFGGSPDIDYRNIDTLNLTATAGNDVIDATFAPGSDLDLVNLSGWTGADQFFLKTTDEQIIGALPTGIQTINLFGDAPGNPNANDGNDIFGQSLAGVIAGTPEGLAVRLIRPSITTAINIDGGRPTAIPNPPVGDQPGDELNLDVSAMLPPVIVATLGANTSLPGVAQSIATPPSHRPVTFIEIEDINLVDELILTEVQMGDLYIRGSNNPDAVSFLATTNPNVPRVRVNAFQGFFTVTRKVVVYGRGGNDNIQMGNFNHSLEAYGEEGDDYIAGYNQADKLVGGSAATGSTPFRGTTWSGATATRSRPACPIPRPTGSSWPALAPTLLPDSQYVDILSTLDGSDTMYGGPGSDSMTLGGGNDYAYGGFCNDSIALGLGDDRGYGGVGNDTITGSGGNDLMNGGEGNDILNGELGLDVLIGGGGNDGMNGGDGNDLLFDGRVTYNGVSDNSQTIGDANDVAMAQLLADWVAVAPGTLSGTFTNDRDGVDQVRGQLGADSFSANAADILDFVLGVDTILP